MYNLACGKSKGIAPFGADPYLEILIIKLSLLVISSIEHSLTGLISSFPS